MTTNLVTIIAKMAMFCASICNEELTDTDVLTLAQTPIRSFHILGFNPDDIRTLLWQYCQQTDTYWFRDDDENDDHYCVFPKNSDGRTCRAHLMPFWTDDENDRLIEVIID